MDLSEFLQAVAATPLLDEAERAYYRAHAAGFSDAYRSEVAEILRRHELAFLQAVKAKDARLADETRRAARESMASLREQEARERDGETKTIAADMAVELAYS